MQIVKNKQKTYIWHDGQLKTQESVIVPFLNHSLHYGTGVFEGIRCYMTESGPAVFRLKDHIQRLFHSSKVMGMKVPYTQREVTEAILQTIKKNKLEECYIRPVVYYGERMGLLPKNLAVHVAIAVWSWSKYLESHDTKVRIVKTRRLHPESGDMTAKVSGHYFNSVLAGLEARRLKADEALLLDHKGNIAEGPGENIFFVKGKTIYTPKPHSILPGITRATIMKLANELGYKVIEKDIKPVDIKRYDEAFFVGTAVEVHPIGVIDEVKYKSCQSGSVSLIIQGSYLSLVRGVVQTHKNWRFPVK